MTLAQIEYAKQRMQQQWWNLVQAEQEGQSLDVLEQMYDTYILMAEAFNVYLEDYQRQKQNRRMNASTWRTNNLTTPALPTQSQQQGKKLAS